MAGDLADASTRMHGKRVPDKEAGRIANQHDADPPLPARTDYPIGIRYDAKLLGACFFIRPVKAYGQTYVT